MTGRQDISLPCILESTLENENYGAEYRGADFFLLINFLESTRFLVTILFGTSVLCSSVTVAEINIDEPFSHFKICIVFDIFEIVNFSPLKSCGGVVTCEILCNIDREWM